MDYGMPVLIELDSVEENCRVCKGLGLNFIEINMNFPEYQIQYLDAQKYARLSEKYGIYFTIHLSEKTDIADPNPLVRDAYLKTIEGTVSFAKKIGSPVINMHMNHGIFITLPSGRVYLNEKYCDEYDSRIEEFRNFCEKTVGDSNLKICIENTDGFTGFEKKAVDLFFKSPVFAMTWDIGHSISCNESDMEFILAHVDRLIHFHIHDGTRKETGGKCHQELGSGEINLDSRLSLAMECRARCVIETKTVKSLENSVQWLKFRGLIG